MTQIIISIPDKKVKTFLDFIHDLNYVKIEEADLTVPAWQIKEVQKRLKMIKKNPEHLVGSKEALRHLKSLRV